MRGPSSCSAVSEEIFCAKTWDFSDKLFLFISALASPAFFEDLCGVSACTEQDCWMVLCVNRSADEQGLLFLCTHEVTEGRVHA